MPASKLTELQARVLTALSELPGTWTLTGGAALAGFHTGHRTTRDLDLFWRERAELGTVREDVLLALRTHGFVVEVLQSAPAFTRLLVRSSGESVVLDLVADPVAAIEPPEEVAHEGRRLRLDSKHEILVNKLCAILQRSELRDLLDIGALLELDGDLPRALRDAPSKDGGFTPLTWLWIVRELPVEAMARTGGLSPEETARAVALRDELLTRVVQLTDPAR